MGTITIDRLAKRFGSVQAVDDLSFEVPPGRVTGFLGPNGAGKTTTLRALLGLVTPSSGQALIDGRRYADLQQPARVVGAVLDAASHPGRTGRGHLEVMARTSNLDRGRIPELLDLVGLTPAAGRRTGEYSLGMRQRLALATALLGDPQVLVLDEPANGLDPEGIAWLRAFLRYLAGQGRTVLVSSHVLSEVAQTVDDVVIIAHGRLVEQTPLPDLVARATTTVRVRSPQADTLAAALAAAGFAATRLGPDTLTVAGSDPAPVGEAAARAGVTLHELVGVSRSLEDVFLGLTGGADPAREAAADAAGVAGAAGRADTGAAGPAGPSDAGGGAGPADAGGGGGR